LSILPAKAVEEAEVGAAVVGAPAPVAVVAAVTAAAAEAR
jgi:hypothetical protein